MLIFLWHLVRAKSSGFHQGKKFFGVKGTDLKGMKAAAVVQFVAKTKKADGDESKSIRYKSVFAKSDFESAIKNNKKEVA